MNTVDIIVPTCDNYNLLNHAISSIVTVTRGVEYQFVIVNNGIPRSMEIPSGISGMVIEGNGNLGWEGALVEGVKVTSSPYLLFLNDDVHVPPNDPDWLKKMVETMESHKDVGMVGPMSNFVMSNQHIQSGLDPGRYEVALLIGFCMLLRRSALEQIGGVVTGLPGGDDFDLSIRMMKAGYKLCIQADAYVHHWGSVTGTRLHGADWNSNRMIADTRNALIRKHKLRPYLATLNTAPVRMV